jgi:hypothetical protein
MAKQPVRCDQPFLASAIDTASIVKLMVSITSRQVTRTLLLLLLLEIVPLQTGSAKPRHALQMCIHLDAHSIGKVFFDTYFSNNLCSFSNTISSIGYFTFFYAAQCPIRRKSREALCYILSIGDG